MLLFFILFTVIFLFIVGFVSLFVLHLWKKNKSSKNIDNQNFFDSESFKELYQTSMQNLFESGYQFENEESLKYYSEFIPYRQKNGISFDQILKVFNKKTSKFLKSKIKLEKYLQILEAYIFMEGLIREGFYQLGAKEFNERLNIKEENQDIYNYENITSNNYEKSNLREATSFNNFDIEVIDYKINEYFVKKAINIHSYPKFNYSYEPSKEITLSIEELEKNASKIVSKMNHEEQKKFINDFFNN